MDLVAHITATKDFLHNIIGNACYVDVLASQSQSLSDLLETTTLPIEHASAVVRALQGCGFDDSTTTKLVAQVGAATARIAGPSEKLVMQDYRNMSCYFTTEEWDEFSSMQAHEMLKHMASRAAQLGLKHPSEKTIQLLTSISLAVGRGFDVANAMSAFDKFEVFKHVKELVKSCEGSHMGPRILPVPAAHRDVAMMKAIFGKKTTAVCPLDSAKLSNLASKVPCRSSSKLLRCSLGSPSGGGGAVGGAAPGFDAMQMMQNMMMGLLQQRQGNPLDIHYFSSPGGKRRRLTDSPTLARQGSRDFLPPTLPALCAKACANGDGSDDDEGVGEGERSEEVSPVGEAESSAAAPPTKSVAEGAAAVVKAMSMAKAAAKEAAAVKKLASKAKPSKPGPKPKIVEEPKKPNHKVKKMSKEDLKRAGMAYYEADSEGNKWVCYATGGKKGKTFSWKTPGDFCFIVWAGPVQSKFRLGVGRTYGAWVCVVFFNLYNGQRLRVNEGVIRSNSKCGVYNFLGDKKKAMISAMMWVMAERKKST